MPKSLLLLLILTIVAATALVGFFGASSNRTPSNPGWPEMHIVAVTVPSDNTKPLEVQFKLFNTGTTATAVSQWQFSAALITAHPCDFSGALAFPPEASDVFRLMPGDRVSLSATARSDRNSGKPWSEVLPRATALRLYINSTKSQEYPDQWLGQTYSDDYALPRVIPR